MNRFKAALLHLFGTACIVLLIFLVVRLVWYPGKLFEAASGTDLIAILGIVDVVLGPLVTLIIFSPSKPSLKTDLAIVVLVQLGFLIYGIYSIYVARPVYIPFDEDRFYLVTANEIDPEDRKKVETPVFKSLPLAGPQIVGTELPEDPGMREKIKFGGMVGMGIQVLPQYYVPYDHAVASIKKAAVQANELAKSVVATSKEDITRLTDYEAAKRAEGKNVRFVRLITRKTMLYIAIDMATGEPVEIL